MKVNEIFDIDSRRFLSQGGVMYIGNLYFTGLDTVELDDVHTTDGVMVFGDRADEQVYTVKVFGLKQAEYPHLAAVVEQKSGNELDSVSYGWDGDEFEVTILTVLRAGDLEERFGCQLKILN